MVRLTNKSLSTSIISLLPNLHCVHTQLASTYFSIRLQKSSQLQTSIVAAVNHKVWVQPELFALLFEFKSEDVAIVGIFSQQVIGLVGFGKFHFGEVHFFLKKCFIEPIQITNTHLQVVGPLYVGHFFSLR